MARDRVLGSGAAMRKATGTGLLMVGALMWYLLKSPAGAVSGPGAPATLPPGGGSPSARAMLGAVGSQGEVRVGSWNIEWLGKPGDRSGAGQGVSQDPEKVADCIVASRVDVLGVCEIVTTTPGTPIRSREIERTLEAVQKRTGDPWSYVLYPGRASGDQWTGVLWNSRVVRAETADGRVWDQTKDQPWAVAIPRGRSAQGSSLWNRPPHAMKFSSGRGKTDFVLIVLHMKADYQGDFASHRGEEAAALVGALPGVRARFRDGDVVLVGDTNCTAPHEAAIRAFEEAGFVDLNSGGRTTHWRGGATDRGLVPRDQPEFKGSGFEVMSDSYLGARGIDAREYKRRYSDHYLVVTTVRVMDDDD